MDKQMYGDRGRWERGNLVEEVGAIHAALFTPASRAMPPPGTMRPLSTPSIAASRSQRATPSDHACANSRGDPKSTPFLHCCLRSEDNNVE